MYLHMRHLNRVERGNVSQFPNNVMAKVDKKLLKKQLVKE